MFSQKKIKELEEKIYKLEKEKEYLIEKNKKEIFNIYDKASYSAAPDVPAIIDGVLLTSNTNAYLTWKNLVEYLLTFEQFMKKNDNSFVLSKNIIDSVLSKLTKSLSPDDIIDKQTKDKIKQSLIDFQINELQNNKFNPRDPKTFDFASDKRITKIDGVYIYSGDSENPKYLFETEYVEDVKEKYDFELKNEFILDKRTLEEIAKESALFYLGYSGEILKSDLTIKGYNFTLAQYEMIKDITDDKKEILVDVINNHFTNKEKKYRLGQEIFYKHIEIDNMFFQEICYVKDLASELELMEEYYFQFEPESLQELKDIIDNDYLNIYQGLKQSVYEHLIDIHGLED